MATDIATMPLANEIAVGFALLLIALALHGYGHLRATTLAAPCLWVALVGVCLGVGALAESRMGGMSLSAFRFAVAASTFCPLMAVLGAKRPQDRGWQWVVLSLWIVLVWPAAQAALLPVGVELELFVAWKIFLWGLIGLGLLNYLPTRYWAAALLVAIGQMLLLNQHLGLAKVLGSMNRLVASLVCFVLAGLIIALLSVRARRQEGMPLEERWLDFRDSYGAFWALRILGRINHAAELRDWPLRLNWGGFDWGNQPPTEQQLAELQQAMETLLRRFVDRKTLNDECLPIKHAKELEKDA